MSDTLGIDLGTTTIKIARFDIGGEMIACVSRGYHRHDEHEVPIGRIWSALVDGTRELVGCTPDRPSVAAIGLASQTNSFALIGENGEPISPVRLWTLPAAISEASELNDRFACSLLSDVTGMTAITHIALASKCLWLQREHPAEWRQAHGIRLLSDLVTARLCGYAVTDPSTWALTAMYDLNTRDWWAGPGSMLEVLGVSRGQLPRIGSTRQAAGALITQAATELSLPVGIPVAVPVLDHLAAAISVGNSSPHLASLSTGTAACVIATHDTRPHSPRDGVVGRSLIDPSQWYALTWSGLSSSGLNWYARQCGQETRLADLLTAAGQVSAGADGWRAIPREAERGDEGFNFVRADDSPGGRPEEPQAVRAIIECLSDRMATLLQQAADGHPITRLIAVGGGAQSDVWLQVLADRTGIPVVRPPHVEASARGASRLAALACGLITSLQEATPPASTTFTPRQSC